MSGWRERATLVGPASVLLLGMVGAAWIQPSERMQLQKPLSEFPASLEGYAVERRLEIPEGQLRVLRPDDYLVWRYGGADGDGGEGAGFAEGDGFELFVGWFGKQLEGATIHSPRNCLPGGGWEPVEHRRVTLETERYRGTVNRYVIQSRTGQRALVYYWYQGRGRVEANEYLVKWELLRDALVKRRTDEALVRLVFPMAGDEGTASDAGVPSVVGSVADALAGHLPAG